MQHELERSKNIAYGDGKVAVGGKVKAYSPGDLLKYVRRKVSL